MTNFNKDFLFALKLGILSMLAASLLLFAGGFLAGGFEVYGAVTVWRSGMCIIAGLLLILVSGTILFKNKMVPDEKSHWRERFKVLNYGSVMGIIAVSFILGAVIADYIYLMMAR